LSDCSGTIYTDNAAVDAVCGDGDKLFRAADPSPVAATWRSFFDGGGACIPFGVNTTSMTPAVEVIDPRYPYPGPLQIVYE
jgi:hypothetical protein